MKAGTKKGKKIVTRALTLLLLAVLVWAGVTYFAPMLTGDAVATYQAYTVQRGDVKTNMSLSATISVRDSETLTTTESVTVREVFVTEEQQVSKGDKIIQLSSGDVLRASFDGVVNEIRVAAGDWLRRNTAMVQICNLDHLQVSMNVDEYDIEQVSVGQQCTVTVISLGGSYETEIAHINRVSASPGSVAYYTVTADLAAPENLLPGMQATVSIPTEEATDVLILPMEALGFDEEGNAYVLTSKTDGGYDRVTVETGLSDGMNVEIKSGVNEGDTVYAQTGEESAQPAFSLEALYQAVVGKKVVINDMSSRGGKGNRGQNGTTGEMGEGAPPEGFGEGQDGEMPAGMPQQSMEPQASAQPQASAAPAASAAPDQSMLPSATGAPMQRQPATDSAGSPDRPAGSDRPSGPVPTAEGGTQDEP